MDDIYQISIDNKGLKEKFEKAEEELINLKSIKIENEAKLIYQDERIKSLILECDLKSKAYLEIEKKMLFSQEVIEEKNLKIKDLE